MGIRIRRIFCWHPITLPERIYGLPGCYRAHTKWMCWANVREYSYLVSGGVLAWRKEEWV